MLPPVSLLIPCYNGAQFLARLIASARAQSVPFSEVICYDDGSTDDTASVAQDLGISLIRDPQNHGSGHARNRLWRSAACEWVHFHDADDFLHPDFVQQMITKATNAVDVVICAAEWRAEQTGLLERTWTYSEAELRADPISYLLTHPVGGINGLYRRAALEKIGGFDETLRVWEDADLHVRLAASLARFSVVEKALVTALRRSESVSAPMLRNWHCRLVALQKYAATLPDDTRSALVAELETAANALLRYGDSAGARTALRVGRDLGGDLPTTAHPLLRSCKRLLGPMNALRLQAFVRRT